MAVLVTGGAGFIGSHIVDKLIDAGFDVVSADKALSGYINSKAQYYTCDLNSDELEKVFKENKIKYVIHMAAQASVSVSSKQPMKDMKDNIEASLRLFLLCEKYNVNKVLVASTAAVYAHPEYLPVDENHRISVLSNYAISKNTMEQYLRVSGLDYLIFRYSNVYGPRQSSTGEAGVVSIFTKRMIDGLPIEIHGDGTQVRDFIYVEDVANMNVVALRSELKNETLNISSNTETTVNELFEALKLHIGYAEDPVHTSSRVGDIKKSVLDNSKMIEMLGYKAETPFVDGIKKTIDFFDSQK